MAIAICVLAVAVLVLLGTVIGYERELRGMARFLGRREPGSNERVTVEFATPGLTAQAQAVNALLDAQRDARIAEAARQRAFREDLSALSHDIRTPLAGAQGYLQLHDRTDDPAEQRRCRTEAAARLDAMRELVDGLFEYAKAGDPDRPLACTDVEAYPLLARVLAGAYPEFAARGWEPEVVVEDEGLVVRADPEALARVFANLLANALRHGTAAPRIEQRGRSVSFANRVADAGAIDPERLFERFYRADGARSGTGSGLGLAIVGQLCERMGARTSACIAGDVLTVTVELAAPEEQDADRR